MQTLYSAGDRPVPEVEYEVPQRSGVEAFFAAYHPRSVAEWDTCPGRRCRGVQVSTSCPQGKPHTIVFLVILRVLASMR